MSTALITMPSSAAGRIGSFIRLLGSDRSGEIVAAAGALRRALDRAGLDLHSLAEVAERGLTAPPIAPRFDDADGDAALVIKFCIRHADALTDRKRQFIADLDRLARRLGPQFRLTPKQEVWLAAIFERLRGVR